MKALPTGHFTVCDYKYFLRVPDNYHLEYDGHYYSIAYTMHGKPALLKATMSEIRICDENNRLLCTHVRSYKDFPRYITDDAHMPPEHRYYKELNSKCRILARQNIRHRRPASNLLSTHRSRDAGNSTHRLGNRIKSRTFRQRPLLPIARYRPAHRWSQSRF